LRIQTNKINEDLKSLKETVELSGNTNRIGEELKNIRILIDKFIAIQSTIPWRIGRKLWRTLKRGQNFIRRCFRQRQGFQIFIGKRANVEKHVYQKKKKMVTHKKYHTQYERSLPDSMCTGCAACANKCPVDAIEMCLDHEGFYKPHVSSKCINCGACEKICPSLNLKTNKNPNPKCYALMADDEIRMRSSSGGAFELLSNYVFERGGSVCGVVFTPDFNAEHLVTNKYNDLYKLRYSKYIQSNVGLVYRKIKQCLDKDKMVLFSGCPCQVAGLYAYLDGDRENLITVDILCHGIPSVKAWRKYLRDVHGDKPIARIGFKDKEIYGWHANTAIAFKDGTKYHKPLETDPWFISYLKSINKNTPCDKCKFGHLPRQGDLTIGDFWGIDAHKPELNDNKGTSCVMANSGKGDKIITAVGSGTRVKAFEPTTIQAITAVNFVAHGGGVPIHFSRQRFFLELDNDNMPFEKLTRQCYDNIYDTAVVSSWYKRDYGAILSGYAMCKTLGDIGISSILVDCPKFYHFGVYTESADISRQFIEKHCKISVQLDAENGDFEKWRSLNHHIGTFIAGPGNNWSNDNRANDRFFMLDFVDAAKRKISYAASFGVETEESIDTQNLFKKFNALSVCGDGNSVVMRKISGINAESVLDPVFLCNTGHWGNIVADSGLNITERYIFADIMEIGPYKSSVIKAAQSLYNQKLNLVLNPSNHDEQLGIARQNGFQPLGVLKVEDWLYNLKNAEFVITDSFAALCFAVIFKKNFIQIIIPGREDNIRITSLLEQLGLTGRIINYNENIGAKTGMLKSMIDYKKVYGKLNRLVEKSLQWLKDSLQVDVNITVPTLGSVKSATGTVPQVSHLAEINNTLRHISILGSCGGSVFDYFIIKGITKIALYGNDDTLSLLWEQAYHLDIELKYIISDIPMQLKLNYPREGKIPTILSSEITINDIDMPVLLVTDGLRHLGEFAAAGKALYNFYSLFRFSYYKRTLFDKAAKFGKENPEIPIVVLNHPSVFSVVNPSEIEKEILKPNTDTDKIYQNTFAVYGKDKQYFTKTLKLFETIKRNGRIVLMDVDEDTRKVVGNKLVTSDLSHNAKHTVLFFGNSICGGIGTDYTHTTESALQRYLNAEYNGESPFNVLNCVTTGGTTPHEVARAFEYEPIRRGDIIVFYMNFDMLSHEIWQENFLWVETQPFFNRPHPFGEIFLDKNNHLNHIGYAKTAEILLGALRDSGILDRCAAIKPVEIRRYRQSTKLDPKLEQMLQEYLHSLEQYRPIVEHGKIGSIVMNCNPFTLGHRYLIEYAASRVDKLFVFAVEEDKSFFPFLDRIELIHKGTADLSNVTVLPSGKFIISQITFKAYFIKDEIKDSIIDPSDDIEIFAERIAPKLNISVRFAGEEPLDNITLQYNQTMGRILPGYGINFEVIPRREYGGNPISASRVRALLKEKKFDEIAKLVPDTTLQFLRTFNIPPDKKQQGMDGWK
jgi:coenzyme F420-reducing hydrogenase beta subunit